MKIVIGLLKLILKIVAAPVVVVLTVAIWMCVGIVYVVLPSNVDEDFIHYTCINDNGEVMESQVS